MKAELSPAMVKALQMATAGGQSRLIRWPGGYWMGRMRQKDERAVIGEYAGTQTVQALLDRGYLQSVASMSRGDPWICELTDKAKEALKTDAPNSDQNEIRTGRRAE